MECAIELAGRDPPQHSTARGRAREAKGGGQGDILGTVTGPSLTLEPPARAKRGTRSGRDPFAVAPACRPDRVGGRILHLTTVRYLL